MKKLILLLALAIFVLKAVAMDVVSSQDTIVRTITTVEIIDSLGQITKSVTEEERTIKSAVVESPVSKVSSDGVVFDAIFSWKKKKFLSAHWSGVGMGFMNYDDKNIPNGALKVSSSHNFTLNIASVQKQISNSNWLLVSGFGLEWSRYHFDDNAALTKVDGITVFEKAPEGVSYKDTKLLAYYLTIPLLLEYQTSHFHVSGGLVGFLKYYSKSQVKYYEQEGKVRENKGRDLNIRPVDVRLRLQVGIDDVSIFGYYAPFSMFPDDKGPDLKTYTIGLMVSF